MRGGCGCNLARPHHGGRRTRRRSQKRGGYFVPSVMGAFAKNAAILTPLAFASGYRLLSKQNNNKKRGKRSKVTLRRRRR